MSAKLKNVSLIVLSLTLVTTLFQNCAQEVPDTSDAASTESAPNAPKHVYALGTTIQTANLTTTGGTWVDIPGLTMTFTLDADKTLHMAAHGSVSQVLGNQATAHCGFRFTVNGTPYGDATWGDVIIQVGNWTNWRAERHVLLPAGTYTVKAQQVGWSGNTAGCGSNTNAYSAGRMTLTYY